MITPSELYALIPPAGITLYGISKLLGKRHTGGIESKLASCEAQGLLLSEEKGKIYRYKLEAA